MPRAWLASFELNASRWWDERFNVANITALLDQGRFEPANFWYGTLSYLPQWLVLAASDAVHDLTGAEAFEVLGSRGLTPSAYLICRLLQVCYGVLSLLLTFVVGRKLFSAEIGLIGACILAASPRHVHASAIFKPDILLLLTSLVALLWSFRVARQSSTRNFLLAGVGIGLATATKLNGGTLAIPLIVVTAAGGLKDWRRWLRLALAGLASFLTFLATNPFLDEILRYFARNRKHYERIAARNDDASVLGETSTYLFENVFHGPLVSSLSLAGTLLVARWLFRRSDDPALRWQRAMFLSYPIAYFFIYTALTSRAKANHFLQILPFSAILAAVSLQLAWLYLAGTRIFHGRLPRHGTIVAFALALATWSAASSFGYAYDQVIPETREQAARFLARALPRPAANRLVVYERGTVPSRRLQRSLGAASRVADKLADFDAEALDRSDAEVFFREALDGETAQFYLRRVARLSPPQIKTFRSDPFRVRGPELMALLHPLPLLGRVEGTLAAERRDLDLMARGTLPPSLAAGELVSLKLTLPLRRRTIEAMSLRVGAHQLPLESTPAKRRHAGVLSPRFRIDGRDVEARVRSRNGSPTPGPVEFLVYRWSSVTPEDGAQPAGQRVDGPESGLSGRRR